MIKDKRILNKDGVDVAVPSIAATLSEQLAKTIHKYNRNVKISPFTSN